MIGMALGRVAPPKDDGDAQAATLADLKILQAWYGDPTGSGSDVTSTVSAALGRGNAEIKVDNTVFTDSAPGHRKMLWLRYTLRGKEKITEIPEGEVLTFAVLLQTLKPVSAKVVSATYQGVNVTSRVAALVANGAATIHVTSADLAVSDPAIGVSKTLAVTFLLADGSTRVLSAHDGEYLSLATLAPLKTLPFVSNGAFDSSDTSMFVSDHCYVPAGQNILSKPGTFTISQGILRPFQLDSSIRADFVEHTGRSTSQAMWVNPVPGRQPVLLWEEKVAVESDTNYEFSCYAADISDSDDLAATIALEVGDSRMRPTVINVVFGWKLISMKFHSGAMKEVFLKIWRDVLPYDAKGAAALGIDDIRFASKTPGPG